MNSKGLPDHPLDYAKLSANNQTRRDTGVSIYRRSHELAWEQARKNGATDYKSGVLADQMVGNNY